LIKELSHLVVKGMCRNVHPFFHFKSVFYQKAPEIELFEIKIKKKVDNSTKCKTGDISPKTYRFPLFRINNLSL